MSDATLKESSQGACPFQGTRVGGAIGIGPTLDTWWPERLRAELLPQKLAGASPLRPDFVAVWDQMMMRDRFDR